jgi:small subunit ribosomal protein S16
MLKIKLFPRGKKHQRTFRIVVAERRSKSNGKVTADLGFYTPQSQNLQIDRDQLAKWIKNGAQATLGVDRLLNPDKHPKKIKVKKAVKKPASEGPKVETKPEEVKPVEEVKTKPETPSEK